MTKDAVAVLEVGSQKITCIIGQKGVNGTFLIKSLAECEYEGFCDGDFFDIPSLTGAVKEVLSKTAQTARTTLDKLYVSVPGEFSTARTKEHALAFARKKRIRKREISDLHNSLSLADKSEYVITDTSAVYYTLDDNRRVHNPEGVVSYKLGGLLSYLFAKKSYVRLLTNICKSAGVSNVEFISETLAEAKYLISSEDKDVKHIIIDIGYLTTNVYITLGDGVLYQTAFSYGGGYITADLMKGLDIDFELAERLKRKVNLGYDINYEGNYLLVINDEDYPLPLQKTNFTVRFCLDKLASLIDEALHACPLDLRINTPIGITGGGIAYMRGAKEYMASMLEMPVQILSPNIPYMNKPEESACLSLLNEALERSKN
ncbi:MAG: rod shape-determining protein [Clostridia bacterium]|nr:rod shape-determining protein [Clostridia bacterium]